jgi:hypothetical protein
MDPQKDLTELSRRLQESGGANIAAIVLYGSAAGGEFSQGHSDLNVLCLLNQIDSYQLAKLRPVSRWWWRKGHPAPMVFTLEELRDMAGVFPIELLDIKERHRMLLGQDFLSQLEISMELHGLQVKRELRTNVLRLRQAFLRSRGRSSELFDLMMDSVSSFAALFRHSLLALGEAPPDHRQAAADRLAALLGLDLAPFGAVLALREGKQPPLGPQQDHEHIFAAYLEAVTQVAQEMDKRLAAKAPGS